MKANQEIIAAGIDEGLRRASRRRRSDHDFDESMQLFLGCIAIATILFFFLPGLLAGTLSGILAGGVVFSALVSIVQHRRLGIGVGRTIVLLVLMGSLMYGVIAGGYWYFMVHLASQPLF